MRLCSMCYHSHTFWSPEPKGFFYHWLSILFCFAFLSKHLQLNPDLFFFSPFGIKLRTAGDLLTKCSNYSDLSVKSLCLNFLHVLSIRLMLKKNLESGLIFMAGDLAKFLRGKPNGSLRVVLYKNANRPWFLFTVFPPPCLRERSGLFSFSHLGRISLSQGLNVVLGVLHTSHVI